LERPARRYEPGGAAAGAPLLRRTVQGRDAALHAAPRAQTRHDGVGADSRPARAHVAARSLASRHVLCRELVVLAGPADPLAHVVHLQEPALIFHPMTFTEQKPVDLVPPPPCVSLPSGPVYDSARPPGRLWDAVRNVASRRGLVVVLARRDLVLRYRR